jgi:hypothetical protein
MRFPPRIRGLRQRRWRRLAPPRCEGGALAANVRPIPPSDPDFAALFSRRNDAESINRGIVDAHYLGRAHSLGHARQHLNLLGYALMANSLALHGHALRRAGPLPDAA